VEINYNKKYYRLALIVILISFAIRALMALLLEFGNDEVYYWLYAKYPAMSFFDHPVGLSAAIRLFTFDLYFDSEFAIRLASVLPATFNGFLIYYLLKWLKGSKAGFYGVVLYYSSIYTSVIAGVFIIPDGPLSTLWLLAILFALRWEESQKALFLILAALFIGLATLTKYHALFLWIGIGLYIVFYQSKQLKKPSLYLSVGITLISLLPIIIWNSMNDWQSFAFHENRVGITNTIRFDYFFRELFGQFLYNNPILVVLIGLTLWKIRSLNFGRNHKRMLLLLSLPAIFTFLLASVFKPTLPHWSAPGYYPLILLSAIFLSEQANSYAKKWLVSLATLFLVVIVFGFSYIQIGFTTSSTKMDFQNLGKNDPSLDMYGWKKSEEIFKNFMDTTNYKTSKVVAKKWFNAAHADYYICQPNNLTLIALGSLNDIHEYRRINEIRGGIKEGEDAWFFAWSRHFTNPQIEFSDQFENIVPQGVFPIKRNGKTVQYFHIFYLENYKNNDGHQ